MSELRVLLVEDSEEDATLIVRELKRGGFQVKSERVDTPDAMLAALERQPWDVVVSDYSMPSFDAPAALALIRARSLDLPFIIASGTIGEEAAVAALKAGAHDFIVKDRLARLVPAVERELREAKGREAHRQASRALQASEMRFRRLADSGVIGIIVVDPSGEVREANDAFLEMVGHTRDELAAGGLNWRAMTPAEHLTRSEAAVVQVEAHGHARPMEKEYIRKDGTLVPVLVGAASLDGTQNIVVTLDLSHRKSLENQLRQAQKMEAIGGLAGGVAHDFNNLLSVVLTYTNLILDGLMPGDPLRADLEEIGKAATRAADLTRQLLAFSRQQMLQPRIVDLNHIVLGMEKMLRRVLGEDVDLSLLTSPGLGRTFVDPGQVEQIIMNLVVNARDAMPRGGSVTIETAETDLDETYADDHVDVTPGRYVMLAVSDTGTGMTAEVMSHIFEPFFTTKEKGKGTGLGLSTVFGIAKQSGGHVLVYSEPGKGTTFKIYFPRTDKRGEEEISTPPPALSLQGTETILLVEDEEQVRTSMRVVLRRQGYHVLEAQNGGEAFLICEEFGAAVHLLITDVVMPRMSGRQLAERLAPLRPEMRVLYVSGYTENAVVHHGVLDAGVWFLQKPITPDQLARRVREILDAPRKA